MNAGRVAEFARGASWHLDVAVPQLESLVRSGDEAMRLAVTGHLEHAAADISATGTDALLGRRLTELASHPPDTTDRARALLGSVRDAQRAVSDHLDTQLSRHGVQVDVPSTAAALDAPEAERALVRTAEDARRMSALPEAQRARLLRTLEHGRIEEPPVSWVGGYGNGNGAMPVVRVHDPAADGATLLAVHRPPTAHAAQEDFVFAIASRLGVDHLFAPVARRVDGSALVQLVEGNALWDEGVTYVRDLERLAADGYLQRFPNLPASEAEHAARLDTEAYRLVDWLTAQPDRNLGGALASRERGTFRILDNGLAGRGERHDVLRPAMREQLMGVGGVTPIAEDSRRLVATRLTDEALETAHARLRMTGVDLPEGHRLALSQDASPRYLEAMRQRRDHAVATGTLEWEPLDNWVDPIAHVDWLNGGGHPW